MCRPSAHDKALWRDQTSTPVNGSSQFESTFARSAASTQLYSATTVDSSHNFVFVDGEAIVGGHLGSLGL
jgi:hypothetical protein